jgi:hypothetical protein
MRHRAFWVTVSLAAVVGGPSAARAEDDWKGLVLDYDLFGHLKNTADGRCAATATLNSFQFLANRYKKPYAGTKLLQGTLAAPDPTLRGARDLLHGGYTFDKLVRPGIPTCQSNAKEWWQAKNYWLEDFAPGTTTVGGMVGGTLNPKDWHRGDELKRGYPTFAFLLAAVQKRQDVEIAYYRDGTAEEGHAVTLIGVQWQNAPANDKHPGTWDPGTEPGRITFIDPNDPTKPQEGKLLKPAGNRLRFEYKDKVYHVQLAYTESPCGTKPKPKAPKSAPPGSRGPLPLESPAAGGFTCAFSAVPEPAPLGLTAVGVALLGGLAGRARVGRRARRGAGAVPSPGV